MLGAQNLHMPNQKEYRLSLTGFQKELWLVHEALPEKHPRISCGGKFILDGSPDPTLISEALKQQAVYQYQQTLLSGFRKVEDALIKTTKTQEQLEAQKRQVQALEEYARISRLQFESGNSNYLQVLDADRSLFSGRLAFNQTKFELLTTNVSVYKAMGGGWANTLLKVNPKSREETYE